MKKIFLISISLLALFSCSKSDDTPTPGTVVFTDNFDNNRNRWPSQDTGTVTSKVVAGKYVLSNVSQNAAVFALSRIATLDTAKGFKIEADFEVVSSVAGGTYGFAPSLTSTTTYKGFYLNNESQYKIANSVASVETVLVPYTPTTLNSVNVLTLEKSGRDWNYRINGNIVNTFTNQNLAGQGIGFYCGPGVTVKVDHVSIIQY